MDLGGVSLRRNVLGSVGPELAITRQWSSAPGLEKLDRTKDEEYTVCDSECDFGRVRSHNLLTISELENKVVSKASPATRKSMIPV